MKGEIMRIKNLFILALLVVFTTSLWAMGGRDGNEARIAEDPSGFTDTIDTTNKKPGKYNYYLEATDRAGNVTLSGPENIFVDPESDLPRVTVINPSPFMRVQGNMNIVGLAFDDDGIQKVEFAIYRGIDGKGEELVRGTAEGTDFWSYFLNTTNQEIWTDGNYTIVAWATDTNGLSGIADEYPNGMKVPVKAHKTHKVFWTLDRKKPETLVTSHEVGALVAGNVRLRGTVADGNGIDTFRYSLDGGNRYITAKTSLDKRSGIHSWDININTKQFEDGPAVIWFQAVDGAGSIGTAAHLLFVNNTGPNVKIVYPEPNSTVNGVFSISAYAQHPVGLRSITWKAGNQSGEFDFLPGNHWYSADVDLRGQKLTSIDVEVRAVDVSGNSSVTRQRYKVDQNADLPVVTLTEPTAGVLNNPVGLVVKGEARDNDGIASIFYSLNGAAPVELKASTGNFQFVIPRPNEGTHNLEVWAKDTAGVVGNKTQVRGIVVPGALPQPGIASFVAQAARPPVTRNFFTGMTIRPEPRMVMNLAYRASAAPASATVAIGNASPVPVRLTGSKDVFTAAVPFPENLDEGLVTIRLTAADRFGREVVYDEYVFVTYDVPDEFNNIMSSLRFAFNWARPNTLNDGRILMSSPEQVLMGIATAPIRGVTVNGGSGVTATVDEFGRVLLYASQEGDLGQFTLRLQTDDGSHQSAPFRIVSDFSGPTITLQGVQDYSWVRNSAPVRFSISSRNRLATVEYSVDMGVTWLSLGPATNEYNRNIDISTAPDGAINILIRATSDTGKSAIADFTVLKDTVAPVAKLVMPIPEARVNGTIKLAFAIEEFGSLQSVTYRRNAAAAPREVFNADNWEKNYDPRFLEVLMDSLQMPLDNAMRFTFTDKSGNSSEVAQWPFLISPEDDIPIVHIILPLEDEVITTDFIVSGVMFDDDGIKGMQWRMDNGPWQTIEAEYGFSVPIALSTLTDNVHTVTVIAEDIYGVRSSPVTRSFRVSLSEPAATMTEPRFDQVLKDEITLRGTAFDRNGIGKVEVSVDNGNTFNTVRGTFGTAAETVQWNYQFNSKILKDGAHVVFIRATDRYGIPATYANMINVDNTAPEIILDSPADGSLTTGRFSVMGRVLDPNLQEVNVQLRSLEGATLAPGLRNRSIGSNMIIREQFDMAGQPDGHYNMTVIATDKAGNVTRTSRNFELARQTFRPFIEILYPLENEDVSGQFNLYGFAGGGSDPATSATIRVNGRDVAVTEVADNGFFSFSLDSEAMTDGINAIVVHSNFGGSSQVQSRAYNLNYMSSGPWVTISNFNFGDFAYDRPYLTGRSGYILSEEDKELLADRSTDRETRAAIQAKAPDFTEISFDNGRTFKKTSKAAARDIDYRYRIETYDMPEGFHYIVLRTTMKNGEIAVTRMLVQVDKTPPVIRLISPEAGGRYNTAIAFSASATDDIELVSLTYHLRVGDKAMYAVPGFLQGLYIEATIPPVLRQAAPDIVPAFFAGGATYMDIGLGLSFFDDNVKIQAQYGFLTQELYEALGGVGPVRYGGHVLGIKLLASIYTLPFITVLGPDFEWLYASLALGANFSLFDIAQQGYTQSGTPTWMSAMLVQLEFPKVSIPKRKSLRTFSLFTEGQLWFVPTDVDAAANDIPTIIPHVIMGLRLYIF